MNKEEFLIEIKKLVSIDEFNKNHHLLNNISPEMYRTFISCIELCGLIENSYEALKIIDELTINTEIEAHQILFNISNFRDIIRLLYGNKL